MRTLTARLCVMMIALLPAGPALADGDRSALMVAAEVEPGLGVDAHDVRVAVGAELHRPITAPSAAPGGDVEDVLLVSMTRARTVVSFRARGDEGSARAIPTPADRAGRLRAVAWLAGNLARDQVSPLVMAAATQGPAAQPTQGAGADHEDTATVVVATPTAPPHVVAAEPATSTDQDVNQLRREAQAPARVAKWLVTFAGGGGYSYWGSRVRLAEGTSPIDLTWQLEVKHRQASGWLLGGAVDYLPNSGSGLGYAITAGVEQELWRGFRLEESFGLGLEPGANRTESTTVGGSSLSGPTSTTIVSSGPAVYSRGFLTATYPLWRSWEVVARVGARFSLTGSVEQAYALASVGLGIELP